MIQVYNGQVSINKNFKYHTYYCKHVVKEIISTNIKMARKIITSLCKNNLVSRRKVAEYYICSVILSKNFDSLVIKVYAHLCFTFSTYFMESVFVFITYCGFLICILNLLVFDVFRHISNHHLVNGSVTS